MMSTMSSWSSCRAATSSLDRIDTQMRNTSSPVPSCSHHRRQNPSEEVPSSSSSAFSSHSSSNSSSSFYSPYDGSAPFSPSSPKQTFEVGSLVIFELSGVKVEGIVRDVLQREHCHVEIIGTQGRSLSLPTRNLKLQQEGRF